MAIIDYEKEEPEVELWRAVINRAIDDLLIHNRRQDAVKWIMHRDFSIVAEYAKLDAAKLRRKFSEVAMAHGAKARYLARHLKKMVNHGSAEIA